MCVCEQFPIKLHTYPYEPQSVSWEQEHWLDHITPAVAHVDPLGVDTIL